MKLKLYRIINIGSLYFLLFLSNNCFTQINKEGNSIKSFANTVGNDFLHIAMAPARISLKDCLKLLTLTAITTSFILDIAPIEKTICI